MNYGTYPIKKRVQTATPTIEQLSYILFFLQQNESKKTNLSV